VSEYCLTPIGHFFSYIMAKACYIRVDDNSVRFVLYHYP